MDNEMKTGFRYSLSTIAAIFILTVSIPLATAQGGVQTAQATVTVTEEEKKRDEEFRKGLEEGFKRLVEEEYWKGELEKHQKKKQADLQRRRENARLARLMEYEMFEKIWWYEMQPPRPARPPIHMDYAEAFEEPTPPDPETGTLDEWKRYDQYWQDKYEAILKEQGEKKKNYRAYLDEKLEQAIDKYYPGPMTPEQRAVIRDKFKKAWEQTSGQSWPEEPEGAPSVPDAIGPVSGPVVVTVLVEQGQVDMECTGTGRTDTIVVNLTNKTDKPISTIIPAGTPLTTSSQGYQPYQSGGSQVFLLAPGNTLSKAVRPDVSPHTPDWQSGSGFIRLVALREDPPRPPARPYAPGATVTQEISAYCTDMDLEPAPTDASVKYSLQTGPATPQQELIRELILTADLVEDLHTVCGSVAGPEDFILKPLPPEPGSAGRKRNEPPPQSSLLSFELSGPLEFPGTMEFSLSVEGGTLKSNIASKDGEKGEIVFSDPKGTVEVSVEPTDDPAVLKFNITKLTAYVDSFEALGKSMGDINMVQGSSEKSTGFLDVNTGEVVGTVSVKVWGEKYDEPFPAAGSFTGRFDFPTRKLSLNFSGLSFEPIELKQGLYQRIQPEKFWNAVHLYTIWDETNDTGKKELTDVMTVQLMAQFPEERAEEIAEMMAREVTDMVDEVQEVHEDLKDEGFDFSKLDLIQ
ncbi:MAG: hypothetical protein GY800_06975 [Planctomycetes bacterium]|nr:hypothetical protein [Planctomycetota bacterium]